MLSVEKHLTNIDGININIDYRKVKRIRLTLKSEKEVLVISPYGVSQDYLSSLAVRLLPKLKKKYRPDPGAIHGDKVYLFGKKENIPGFSLLTEKAKDAYLKKTLLTYLNKRYNEITENIDLKRKYVIKVKKMKSQYGVNNRRAVSLTFALELVHFSPKVIDSVIYHELVHDQIFNHQKSFYDLLHQYCPDYDELTKALVNHVYDYQ